MSENNKRRPNRIISLKTKQKIIEMVDSGLTKTQVAIKLNFNESTVRAIYKKRNQFVTYKPETGEVSIGPIQNVTEAIREMERHLAAHIIECNNDSVPVTQHTIMAKAREIYNQLRGFPKEVTPTGFAAAPGWFCRFRNRFKLRRARILPKNIDQTPDIHKARDGTVFTYILEGSPEGFSLSLTDGVVNLNEHSELNSQADDLEPDAMHIEAAVPETNCQSSMANLFPSKVDSFPTLQSGLLLIEQGWKLIQQLDLDSTRVDRFDQQVNDLKTCYQNILNTLQN